MSDKIYKVTIEGQTLELPAEIASDDAKLKAALQPFFPGAANAKFMRSEADGVETVNVVKQAGTKGRITLDVDPDVVEERNCTRQNFCAAEIGRNKAEALAERYSAAWGVEIGILPRRIRDGSWGWGNYIFAGCVDNNEARRAIDRLARNGRSSWWLDCGNTRSYGQVLLGGGEEMRSPLPGYVSRLPLPSDQHPELVAPTGRRSVLIPQVDLSCADMVLQDSQGLSINQRMAAEAADYLVRMLITGNLRRYATYIDLESGTVRSKYIEAEIGKCGDE